MGATTEKRKAELQLKYGDNAFEPISSDYIEQARQLSARYILFVNKDNKHGYCEHCCKDVEFAKTKHKEIVECPNCGTKLMAQHTWRKAKCDWGNINWYVKGECVDEDTFALRYIEVIQRGDYRKEIRESAREIYDFKHGWSYQFSNVDVSGWTVNNRYYFTEFTMNWHRRYECCIEAKPINNILSELKGISALKYFDQLTEYFGIYVYPRDSIKKLMSASLYEKMEKVGLRHIALEDYKDYRNSMKYKRTETSLLKMLGIDRTQLNILAMNQKKESLDFIRSNREMPVNVLEYVISHNEMYDYKQFKELGIEGNKFLKIMNYIAKADIAISEYRHYLDLLQKLEYPLDKSYMYPKDFRKEDDRITDEYLMKTDMEAYKKRKKNNGLIKKISDGLRKMPDLQEFLDGSKGLLVYVPESAEDLRAEGKRLHNCIGTYTDRIANGKTLVFFVRRLETPDAPFVAFEYCNGKVVQCRYDHNKSVDDNKIISFVDSFAYALRKNKVLCA